MNVVHVNEHLARKGGVETYLLSLLPLMEARGADSHVVFGEGDEALWRPATKAPEIGEASFAKDREAERRVSGVLNEQKPDVVHVHNVQNLGALRACLSYGRTVMTAHDYRSICPANTFFFKRTQEVCGKDHGELGCFATTITKHCVTPRPQYGAYFYRRVRTTLRNADKFAKIIAPSQGARERLVRAGFDSADVDVLPYFCPIDPAPKPRPLPARTTITFMGRLAPNKGHEYFVEALGLLPNKVQGVMVGNFRNGVEEEMRSLARRFGCEDRLELRQWASRDEVLLVLDQTTVFIFPSLWQETLGIVGLEALARGVPVVASDIGGVREWLRDGRNGRLVTPKSAAEIRDAVLDLTSSRERLEECGQEGINTINDGFLPQQHVEKVMRLYEQVSR